MTDDVMSLPRSPRLSSTGSPVLGAKFRAKVRDGWIVAEVVGKLEGRRFNEAGQRLPDGVIGIIVEIVEDGPGSRQSLDWPLCEPDGTPIL